MLGSVLYFFAVPFVWAGRKVFEGGAYNVSFASNFGDLALCVMFGIGILVLQQQNGVPPKWLQGTAMQIALLFTVTIAMVTFTVMEHLSSPKQVMDIYHNAIIVPVFFYLTIMLGSVIWTSGMQTQQIFAAFLVLVWAILFIVDIKEGRLNQREWLRVHNPDLHYGLK